MVYEGTVKTIVSWGFDGVKIDSCSEFTNMYNTPFLALVILLFECLTCVLASPRVICKDKMGGPFRCNWQADAARKLP